MTLSVDKYAELLIERIGDLLSRHTDLELEESILNDILFKDVKYQLEQLIEDVKNDR